MIGEPKTKASKADIGLVESIKPFLTLGAPEDFLIGGKKPRSWTELRNAWKRICKAVGLQGITESQFRATMASLLYEKNRGYYQREEIDAAHADKHNHESFCKMQRFTKGNCTDARRHLF